MTTVGIVGVMFHRQLSGGVQEGGMKGGIVGAEGRPGHPEHSEAIGVDRPVPTLDKLGEWHLITTGLGVSLCTEAGTLCPTRIVGINVSGIFTLTRGCVRGWIAIGKASQFWQRS